jgi:glycosyltransferase involved in cell wall biosynthesis
MKILKVTQAHFPFRGRGGPAVKVRSIARELVRQGHQVTVVTADLGFGPAEIAAARAVRNTRGWESQLDGVESIYLATQCHYRNLTVNAGVISFCRGRLRDFSVVHIYGLYDTLGPLVAKYCRHLGIPYFVEPLGMSRPIDRGFWLKRAWKLLAKSYLSEACRIVATSELERDELISEGFPGGRVLLRYNGIDRQEFREPLSPGFFRTRAGIRAGERFILFLGRLIPRKGADLLIESLALIGDDKTKIVIAGPEVEPGYVSTLHAKARLCRVEDRVVFTGPLYDDDKNSALVDAFVLALPSRYENFGNSAAEAIACGTPAVVTDRCGIAPFVDRRAGLVTHYDSAALAGALNALVEDAHLYQKLKAGCSQVADEIGWPRLVKDLQQSYVDATEQVAVTNTRKDFHRIL